MMVFCRVSGWPFPVLYTNLGMPGSGGSFNTTVPMPPQATYVAVPGPMVPLVNPTGRDLSVWVCQIDILV